MLELDSTFCKVPKSACSTLKEQAIGSATRIPKVNVLINDRMQLLNVILTGRNIHDSEPAIKLFYNVDIAGKKILADKAYSCQAIRDYLEKLSSVVCIPDKSTFKTKYTFDAELYKQRKLVERFFSESRTFAIFAIFPRVSTNWLLALRISFYSLLVFNP